MGILIKLPINDPNNKTKAREGGNPNFAKEMPMILIKSMARKRGNKSKSKKSKGTPTGG
jgi:hypothetical protein